MVYWNTKFGQKLPKVRILSANTKFGAKFFWPLLRNNDDRQILADTDPNRSYKYRNRPSFIYFRKREQSDGKAGFGSNSVVLKSVLLDNGLVFDK